MEGDGFSKFGRAEMVWNVGIYQFCFCFLVNEPALPFLGGS
jgi:hypothetical protein